MTAAEVVPPAKEIGAAAERVGAAIRGQPELHTLGPGPGPAPVVVPLGKVRSASSGRKCPGDRAAETFAEHQCVRGAVGSGDACKSRLRTVVKDADILT